MQHVDWTVAFLGLPRYYGSVVRSVCTDPYLTYGYLVVLPTMVRIICLDLCATSFQVVIRPT